MLTQAARAARKSRELVLTRRGAAGETRITFADDQAASVPASLTLQASQNRVVIPLAAGEIRPVDAPQRSS